MLRQDPIIQSLVVRTHVGFHLVGIGATRRVTSQSDRCLAEIPH